MIEEVRSFDLHQAEGCGNVEQGFLVLADWAHGLTMKDADIDQERAIVLESLVAIKRAGASMILTYFATRAALWLNED